MHFDEKALDWDNDPKKVERASVFAKEISNFIMPNKEMNALEFGCGTGLLSFQLKDNFNKITLADNSEGMIDVLKDKIAQDNIKNFVPFHIKSFENDLKPNDYDVIYTLMTMHHILDLNEILKVFNSILNPGGFLCIADLVSEDGSFHSKYPDFNGHLGFNKDELEKILVSNGFNIEFYNICYEIEQIINGEIKKYPLFLMICKKVK